MNEFNFGENFGEFNFLKPESPTLNTFHASSCTTTPTTRYLLAPTVGNRAVISPLFFVGNISIASAFP